MAKVLVFLKIGEAADKSHFLQHIHQLIHVEVKAKDTYNDLFDNLEENLKAFPEALQAAKEWIEINRKENNPDDLKTELLDFEPEVDVKLFAIFDLRNMPLERN